MRIYKEDGVTCIYVYRPITIYLSAVLQRELEPGSRSSPMLAQGSMQL